MLALMNVVCPQSASGDLMIRNIQMKHSGKYVCMVKTEVDSVASAADLIVRGTAPQSCFPPLFKLQAAEITDGGGHRTNAWFEWGDEWL